MILAIKNYTKATKKPNKEQILAMKEYFGQKGISFIGRMGILKGMLAEPLRRTSSVIFMGRGGTF